MTPDTRHWPQLLQEIARSHGEAAALKLVGRLGGQKVAVPSNAAGSALERECGADIAAIVVRLYAGRTVYIPNLGLKLAPERKAFILTNPCLSANDIAGRLGISSRWVEKVRENARPDPRQQNLFDA